MTLSALPASGLKNTQTRNVVNGRLRFRKPDPLALYTQIDPRVYECERWLAFTESRNIFVARGINKDQRKHLTRRFCPAFSSSSLPWARRGRCWAERRPIPVISPAASLLSLPHLLPDSRLKLHVLSSLPCSFAPEISCFPWFLCGRRCQSTRCFPQSRAGRRRRWHSLRLHLGVGSCR